MGESYLLAGLSGYSSTSFRVETRWLKPARSSSTSSFSLDLLPVQRSLAKPLAYSMVSSPIRGRRAVDLMVLIQLVLPYAPFMNNLFQQYTNLAGALAGCSGS